MPGFRDAESHYRLLFEHNPQPMWVYDTETLAFLTVNAAATGRYGYSQAEFLAMGIADLLAPEDLAASDAAAAQLEPQQLPRVWRHRRKDGGIMLVEIVSQDIPFAGRKACLVLVNDVTRRESAHDELRRGQDAYERQYAALAALTRSGVLQTTDRQAALREITQHIAHTLGVERVSVWRFNDERDAIVADDLFERSSARHTSDHELKAAAFPAYFRALAGSDVLVADEAEHDARTSEFTDVYLRPNGITSMLDAPILVDGELAGVLCLEHVGPWRTWTPGERIFAISAANLVALVLAQHALSQSQAWLQTILDSEPECVCLVGADGRLLDMNPAGLRMVEAADRPSVIGGDAAPLIHPSDRDAFLELHSSVQAGSTGRLQFRIIGLRGTERWVETHAAPLRANDGAVLAMIAVTRDISERIHAEAALQETERRLSTLMDHFPGMAYRCRNEPGWPMEFVSNGAAELTGYDPEDLLDGGTRSYASLIHAADRDRVRHQVKAAVHASAPYELEYRITSADGTEKWVWERGQAVHDSDGRPSALEGFISDTTQRRRSADALRISEERFRLLARVTSDAIYDWDITDDTVWWGEGAEQQFGLTREQLGNVLASWVARIHPEDRDDLLAEMYRAVRGRVEMFTAEYRFLRGDGSYANLLDRGLILRNEGGQAVRMIGGVSDLTAGKRLEDQLLHSQKMESVGRLAGGIAHDFNNLLTVILGTVELALNAVDAGDPLSADLVEVRTAAERAAGLTQQLLAFSRRQVLQPRILDVNTTIAGTLVMLRRLIGEDIEIRFTPGADLWTVRADPGQVEQVLLNLAVNARDAMPAGGLLSITTRNRMIDNTYAAGDPMVLPGPHVSIAVSDTGVGMDAETRKHVFEPFFTTKAVGKGTGLGLATVYGIVQQSGGSIRLYSETGHGSTFRILLPRVDAEVDTQPPPLSAADDGGSETILLVEDEAAVMRLAERVLTGVGYTVLSVASAEDALAVMSTHEGMVHLLLTDVVMPQMNGPELADVITELSPETRVLFMSGYTEDSIVVRGVTRDQTLILEKPFTIAELTQAVRSALTAQR
jgi:two-component system, cell cycle sensor histidine kinase and response regulator CckA